MRGSSHLGPNHICEVSCRISPRPTYIHAEVTLKLQLFQRMKEVLYFDTDLQFLLYWKPLKCEGWPGQVMKGTRGRKNSGNAVGTHGNVLSSPFHGERVCFPGSRWCDWKDHTFVRNRVGFLALRELSITDLGQLIKFQRPSFLQVWNFLEIIFLPSKSSWFPF